MKYELWSLVTVWTEEPEEPVVTLHATYREAIAELLNVWSDSLMHYTDEELNSEEKIRDALAGVVDFTIDTAILDTDELGEYEEK